MPKIHDQDDIEAIEQLLLGRRITSAEMGTFRVPGQESWADDAQGRLTLDDGTAVYLAGHDGGCACSAGCYPLQRLGTVDNVITNVRIEAKPASDEYGEYEDGTYRIFVVADATEINVAEFVGTDGNGYYGTGFWLTAVRPAP